MDLEDCATTKSQQHSCHTGNKQKKNPTSSVQVWHLNVPDLPNETWQQQETENAKQEWEKYVRRFTESYMIPALGFEKGK